MKFLGQIRSSKLCAPLGLALVSVLLIRPCVAQLEDVQRSHIVANTPTQRLFNRLLKRDLQAYFHKRNPKINRVEWAFLRLGPTQSGVSYPKFYFWVQLYHGQRFLESGAVRVEAIERREFVVTDFISKASAAKNPRALDTIFPAPVAARIRAIVSGQIAP